MTVPNWKLVLFEENEYLSVKEYLKRIIDLDKDIVLASFFTVRGEEIKAWQFINRQYPNGLGLKSIYNKSKKAWISQVNGKEVVVSDPYVFDIVFWA